MEKDQITEVKDIEDNPGCEDCPIKKRWPPLELSADEKKAMEKPHVRCWGPYGHFSVI
jgi:hypothetical protein